MALDMTYVVAKNKSDDTLDILDKYLANILVSYDGDEVKGVEAVEFQYGPQNNYLYILWQNGQLTLHQIGTDTDGLPNALTLIGKTTVDTTGLFNSKYYNHTPQKVLQIDRLNENVVYFLNATGKDSLYKIDFSDPSNITITSLALPHMLCYFNNSITNYYNQFRRGGIYWDSVRNQLVGVGSWEHSNTTNATYSHAASIAHSLGGYIVVSKDYSTINAYFDAFYAMGRFKTPSYCHILALEPYSITNNVYSSLGCNKGGTIYGSNLHSRYVIQNEDLMHAKYTDIDEYNQKVYFITSTSLVEIDISQDVPMYKFTPVTPEHTDQNMSGLAYNAYTHELIAHNKANLTIFNPKDLTVVRSKYIGSNPTFYFGDVNRKTSDVYRNVSGTIEMYDRNFEPVTTSFFLNKQYNNFFVITGAKEVGPTPITEAKILYPSDTSSVTTNQPTIVFEPGVSPAGWTQQFRVALDYDRTKILTGDENTDYVVILDSFASGAHYDSNVKFYYSTDWDPNSHDPTTGTWNELGTGDGLQVGGTMPDNGVVRDDPTQHLYVKVTIPSDKALDTNNYPTWYIKVFAYSKV